MNNATRVFASTFGAIMALAGIEHGVGEILQGNVAPAGVMIQSWPTSEFFRNLGGEPAMTLIPNLLVTGILAVLVSLALLVWAVLFVHKKNGGFVMILLSIAMLLVGGGIFPPILGILIGVVATRIHSPLTWWRAHLSPGVRRLLASLWPWSYTACVLSWFAMLPGIGLLKSIYGIDDTTLILIILCSAFGTLLLTVLCGPAYNIQIQASTRPYTKGADNRK